MNTHVFEEDQSKSGLPPDPLWERRLLYNAASSTIVLSFVISRDRIPCARLYLRHVSQDSYRPAIEVPNDDFSIQSPVVCVAPFVFFVLSEWVGSGDAIAGDYKGIGRLDLLT